MGILSAVDVADLNVMPTLLEIDGHAKLLKPSQLRRGPLRGVHSGVVDEQLCAVVVLEAHEMVVAGSREDVRGLSNHTLGGAGDPQLALHGQVKVVLHGLQALDTRKGVGEGLDGGAATPSKRHL